MPEIGNLLVSLQVETASFNKGLADANKTLDRFGSQFASIGKNIQSTVAGIGAAFAALGAGAAISAFAGWAKGMADSAESTANLANAMGITVAQANELQGVFLLTTGSLGEASGAMRVFIGHIGDAISKAGPARDTFARMGITLQDLQKNGRDLPTMLKLVADRMAGFTNDTMKAEAGAALFGRAWEKIAPTLAGGSDAVTALTARFKELNPSQDAATDAGNKLDTELDQLKVAVLGLSNEGFVILAPLLIESANSMTTFASNVRAAIVAVNNFLGPLGGLLNLMRQIQSFGLLGAMKGVMEGDWKQVIQGLTGLPLKATEETRTEFSFDIPRGVPKPTKTMPPPSGGGGGKKGGGGGKDDTDKLARAAERELQRRQREAIEEQEELSKLSDEMFRRREQALKHERDMDRLTKQELITAERKLLDEKWIATQSFYDKKLAAAVNDKDETRKLQNQDKLDYEKFITERAALNQQSAKEQHDTWKGLFTDIGGTLRSSFERIFDSLMEGTFKLKDAIGSLLKDIGKKLISKGFDKLFDIGSSAFGKLFSAGLPAAQYGASFKVGGAGALDSQLVAFRASPGEMVNVNRPGESRGVGETIRIALNPSEGWVAGVADQRIVTRSGQIIEVAVRQSSRTVQRNFAGMSAEAQARQL